MGWFDEQIRQRKLSDQEIMEDSLFRMASVVLGRQRAGVLSDERIVTKAAIDDILKFYHYKPVEIPDNVKGLDEQLEFCLRPHGLMYRSVKLEEGWYRDAFGPMLAYRKEDGMAVALLPKPFIGYWFRDPVTGKKTDLNRRTAEAFESDAICFYRPLPLKKLGIADLIKYLAECLSAGDIVSIVAGNKISFGIRADGTVVAAGDNTTGQCDVGDWTDIVAIGAGERHSVGLRADGTVVAAGYEKEGGPCDVDDWRDVIEISCGKNTTIALRSDGTALATGNDEKSYQVCAVNDWKNLRLPSR